MIFYGAGGHAKVVIEAWTASGGKVTAIYDDNEKLRKVLSYKVNGPFDGSAFPGESLVIAIGRNRTRQAVADKLNRPFGKVVHPSVVVSPSAGIERGTVVMAGSIIQSEALILEHCIINTGSRIDHDCFIKSFAHIAPGATLCGGVKVGMGAFIGAGATILPGISIGDWAVVGAGSVVTSHVPEFTVVTGVPARLRNSDDRAGSGTISF